MRSNRFWHIDSVVKERLFASLSSRVASNELTKISKPSEIVNTSSQTFFPVFHILPQPRQGLPARLLLPAPRDERFGLGAAPCDFHGAVSLVWVLCASQRPLRYS